jgi:hypothetical protein
MRIRSEAPSWRSGGGTHQRPIKRDLRKAINEQAGGRFSVCLEERHCALTHTP